MSVVSPFQGLGSVILSSQGGAWRLAPLRFALGWCVVALSGLAYCDLAGPKPHA